MTSDPRDGSLATVTVTFNPDIDVLRLQLEALPEQSLKVLVDNASEATALREIEHLAADVSNTCVLYNERNIGLAAAMNLGVREAHVRAPGARFVLLLDQDSEPRPGSIHALMEGFATLEARGMRVACVGPTLIDVKTGLQHGFHQHTRWRWKRVFPSGGATQPVPCANLNGSGTLVPMALFFESGGLDEVLFIDHVDTEWAFRIQAEGFGLWGIPAAVFDHRMGNDSVRFWWLGWRVWPSRSPIRHYFLFRNAVVLMRRPYVPSVWKAWAIAKLAITACVTVFADPKRGAQVASMWRGVCDSFDMPKEKLGSTE